MLSRIKKFIFKPDCVKQGKTNIIIFKNENGEKKIEVIIKKVTTHRKQMEFRLFFVI